MRERLNDSPAAKWGIVAVVAAAVAVAGWTFYSRASTSRVDEIIARGRPAQVICQSCKKVSTVRVDLQQKFPVVCPSCRQKQAVQAQDCGRCGTVFPLPKTPRYRCPQCRAEFITEQGMGEM